MKFIASIGVAAIKSNFASFVRIGLFFGVGFGSSNNDNCCSSTCGADAGAVLLGASASSYFKIVSARANKSAGKPASLAT